MSETVSPSSRLPTRRRLLPWLAGGAVAVFLLLTGMSLGAKKSPREMAGELVEIVLPRDTDEPVPTQAVDLPEFLEGTMGLTLAPVVVSGTQPTAIEVMCEGGGDQRRCTAVFVYREGIGGARIRLCLKQETSHLNSRCTFTVAPDSTPRVEGYYVVDVDGGGGVAVARLTTDWAFLRNVPVVSR